MSKKFAILGLTLMGTVFGAEFKEVDESPISDSAFNSATTLTEGSTYDPEQKIALLAVIQSHESAKLLHDLADEASGAIHESDLDKRAELNTAFQDHLAQTQYAGQFSIATVEDAQNAVNFFANLHLETLTQAVKIVHPEVAFPEGDPENSVAEASSETLAPAVEGGEPAPEPTNVIGDPVVLVTVTDDITS